MIRFLLSVTALAALTVSAQTQKPAAKSAAHGKSAIPRTPDGHPDFEGVWTNATITPLTRPAQFADKPTLTDAEAKVFENAQATDLKQEDGQSDGPIIRAAGSSGTGGYNVLFVDRGTEMERIDGVKRSSLIVDPPDGKMPPMVPGRMNRRRGGGGGQGESYAGMSYDSVKNRPLSERCLIGFGSTSGPPMLPVLYNNNYQIVQTKDSIMILVEMVHDVRVIRMNAEHEPAALDRWLGDSVGHWEGDTLVVETTNVNPENRFRGSSDKFKVTERFQRVDAQTILYRATIEDPETWTKPWTVEFPFVATAGPVYEYACHEGNYAMDDILGGARKQEKK
ncbi:MAG TPA: hypothetical protein VMG40_15270 [Bryobacteraceae bacterium]|nr:hypothetical protein [Bryobacteraceae bacterium]